MGTIFKLLINLLAVGSAVSILPPVTRKVLPEKVTALPVSAPIDALLAKAFPTVRPERFLFLGNWRPWCDFFCLS